MPTFPPSAHMESIIEKPQATATLKPQSFFSSEQHLSPTKMTADDFDPCMNAKPCSPFYLYNHDSTSELKPGKPSMQVSVQDLENGDAILTPSITQEKLNAQQKSRRLRFWERRQQQRCMTKPKKRGCHWLSSMPRKQRILAKSIIAFLVIGIMVGIAVGIAAGLHSGVWKSPSQQGKIGK